ncbi:HU family DNA-binding protein [Meiothermus sp. QL-1]|uniref:HU family DNA-binding protein n=1 Tax=Meiothermus sp. QL-1 TaxID=2058095 RepID=UPI000E0A3057|nr:HU family DNA-binding protein [Meiothermus sp. QL-1]RDI94502.1 HU family DNA-binding protein [Meiothermus sp. QL-1]
MAKATAKKTKTKADLIDQVAAAAGLKKKDAKAAVDAFISKIEDALKSGSKVQLTGFGTFEVRSRKARTGVKPGTTQKIKIPASKYPAFKPGKALKEAVKK